MINTSMETTLHKSYLSTKKALGLLENRQVQKEFIIIKKMLNFRN